MIERMPEFPTLTIIRHPLVQHKLTIMRNRDTPTKIFKELVDEIAMLMAYEATIDLTLEPLPVTTPLEATIGCHISGKKLTLVPILRAGLGTEHPDVQIYCAALDRELNQQGYILPGLGDAGDRLFGTR